MNKIRIFLNRYFKEIIFVTLIIIFFFILKFALNNASKQNIENIKAERDKQLEEDRKNVVSTYNPSYSVTTGDSYTNERTEENINIINSFVDYCNSGNIEKAYELLSESCKEELYSTIDSFKKNYYNINFKTKKLCSSQLWVYYTGTYKVELYEDSMATGKVDNYKKIIDYYTIIKENDKPKLNISEFIGKETINKVVINKGITVRVLSKTVYKDYEKYMVRIVNETENDILIDSKESTKNVYLLSNTGSKYTAFLYELPTDALEIKSNGFTKLEIKFNKELTTTGDAIEMLFKDVILDAKKYKEMANKKQYTDRKEFSIKLY